MSDLPDVGNSPDQSTGLKYIHRHETAPKANKPPESGLIAMARCRRLCGFAHIPCQMHIDVYIRERVNQCSILVLLQDPQIDQSMWVLIHALDIPVQATSKCSLYTMSAAF